MHLSRIFKIVAGLLLIVAIAGCGSDENSNTNGSLTLTPTVTVSSGVAFLKAVATLTPAQVGSKISFSANQYFTDANGTVQNVEIVPSAELATDPQGTVEYVHNFVQQTVDTTVLVTASSGGLFRSQTILIPKLVIAPVVP